MRRSTAWPKHQGGIRKVILERTIICGSLVQVLSCHLLTADALMFMLRQYRQMKNLYFAIPRVLIGVLVHAKSFEEILITNNLITEYIQTVFSIFWELIWYLKLFNCLDVFKKV